MTSRGLRPRTPSPSGSLALAPPACARFARLTSRGLRPRTPSPSGSLALAPPACARCARSWLLVTEGGRRGSAPMVHLQQLALAVAHRGGVGGLGVVVAEHVEH